LSKFTDLRALTIIKLSLENGDSGYLELVQENPEFFINMVETELLDKLNLGLKWDDFILLFEWKYKLNTYV